MGLPSLGQLSLLLCIVLGWQRGVVVSIVRRMSEVNQLRARLETGWVTVFGQVYRQPTRSTRPFIPPRSLSQVPASAGGRAGMSPLPGAMWQVTLCDPIWHVSSRSGKASCELL